MPFRCKCGRTFEKPDSFGSHTSGCAPFHHRRISTSELFTNHHDQKIKKTPQEPLSIETDPSSLSYFNQRFMQPSKAMNSPPHSAPVGFYGFMMPTALSIHNTFEGVRRRSMSYSSTPPSLATASDVPRSL